MRRQILKLWEQYLVVECEVDSLYDVWRKLRESHASSQSVVDALGNHSKKEKELRRIKNEVLQLLGHRVCRMPDGRFLVPADNEYHSYVEEMGEVPES